MTLDESIRIFEAAAEDCLNIDEEKIGLLYADDTECIEEYKATCIQCSKDNHQLADWLKDYKRLLQKEATTGYWIKSDIGGAKICSVCHSHMGLSNFKYCPNCGTRMNEGE